MNNKYIASCLALLFILSGCQNAVQTQETESLTNTGDEETAAAETEDPFDDRLPPSDFKGADFTILHYDESLSRYYFDIEEDSGEKISSAAYRRNMEIEERFNVSIKEFAAPSLNTVSVLRKSQSAGEGIYDVVVPHFVENKASMMTEGLLSNLRTIPYVDLTRDWWYSYMTDAITAKGQTYYATSDLTVTCQNFFVLLFNNNRMSALQMTEPYEDVFNYTWTMDKLKAMMKTATAAVNGDESSSDNQYGLVTCDNLQYQMQLPLGLQLIRVKDDKVVIDDENQRIPDVVESVYDLLYGGNTFFGDYTNQKYITQFFGGGHALFAYFGMGTYYQMVRGIDGFDYGILPFPMLDEKQEKYVVQRSDSLLCVPYVLSNAEKTGMILEALTCASMKYVRPAFYDEVLYAKCLRDENSEKVLELIFDSFSFEPGFIFDGSRSFASILDNLMSKKSTDSQSFIESKKSSVQKGLDKVNEYLEQASAG